MAPAEFLIETRYVPHRARVRPAPNIPPARGDPRAGLRVRRQAAEERLISLEVGYSARPE
jgi:hypothetical protein